MVKFQHFKSGLSGTVFKDYEDFQLNSKLICPINQGGLPDISTNLFLRVGYEMPQVIGKCKSLILNGYIPSVQMLTPQDRDCIIYKYSNRWNPSMMKYNIVPVGPVGSTQYQPRVGGYRSFFYHKEQSAYTQPRGNSYGQQKQPPIVRQAQSRYNNERRMPYRRQ